jgi:hypothetical protein
MEPLAHFIELFAVCAARRMNRLDITTDRVFQNCEDQAGFTVEERTSPCKIEILDRNKEIRLKASAQPRVGAGAFAEDLAMTRLSGDRLVCELRRNWHCLPVPPFRAINRLCGNSIVYASARKGAFYLENARILAVGRAKSRLLLLNDAASAAPTIGRSERNELPYIELLYNGHLIATARKSKVYARRLGAVGWTATRGAEDRYLGSQDCFAIVKKREFPFEKKPGFVSISTMTRGTIDAA